MTRVNVIPVEELSDAWLLAEYREIPRVLKRPVCIAGAPKRYQLGSGHVKWARRHGVFVCKRMEELVREMLYRGFHPRYTAGLWLFVKPYMRDYTVLERDKLCNRARLVAKYRQNPSAHTWTKRSKPFYLCFVKTV